MFNLINNKDIKLFPGWVKRKRIQVKKIRDVTYISAFNVFGLLE